MCKTDNQREFDVRHRAPKPVLCANLEGWIGREGWGFRREGMQVCSRGYRPPIEVINKLKIKLLKNRNFNLVLSLDWHIYVLNPGVSKARHGGYHAIVHVHIINQTRGQTCILCIGKWILRHWVTRKAPISSVPFSHSVVSDSWWPHELQHARPPCPSPTPRVHPNPCLLSWWCHPAISCSVIPCSSCSQSFPASGSFQMSQLFASGAQRTGVSASTSVLPGNTQDRSPLGWTGWISMQSKGLSRVFHNTTIQKHQFFGAQHSL